MHDPNRPLTPMEQRTRAKLERFAKFKLPGALFVRDGFGHTVIKVGKKSIVLMGAGWDHKGVHLALKSDRFTQDHLVGQGVFTRTPYLGHHGWVSLSTEKDISKQWKAVQQIMTDAYAQLEPKPKQVAVKKKSEKTRKKAKPELKSKSKSKVRPKGV